MGIDATQEPIPMLTDEMIKFALDELGLEINDDNIRQLGFFGRCMQIYQQREKARGGLWKEFGPTDKIHHMGSKFARIRTAYMRESDLEPLTSEMIDDGLDLCNYTVFFLRQITGECDG